MDAGGTEPRELAETEGDIQRLERSLAWEDQRSLQIAVMGHDLYGLYVVQPMVRSGKGVKYCGLLLYRRNIAEGGSGTRA